MKLTMDVDYVSQHVMKPITWTQSLDVNACLPFICPLSVGKA